MEYSALTDFDDVVYYIFGNFLGAKMQGTI